MGQTRRRCPFTACKYEGLKVKKYIMMLGLMMVATSAMAGHNNWAPGTDNCAVWATGADGKAYCQSEGGSNNNNSSNNHNNNNNNNNNQSCGGFNQQQCDWPGSGQPMSPWQYQQVKATGRDAVNIILNSDMLTSGKTNDGWSRYTVRYTGNQYTSLKGVIFNCKSSPNAREFECVNWLPPKPKQVQFGNGNWSIIFEILNQQLNKK